VTDLNNVSIVGRLTRDAELTYTPAGTAVCKSSIAVNRSRKEGETYVDEVSFFDVTLWGKFGESMAKYLLKGKQVGISGELRQARWEKDGQQRSRVEINAQTLQLLSPKESQGEPVPRPANASGRAPVADDGFVDDIDF
jgi:single-strand DNA-binding protein